MVMNGSTPDPEALKKALAKFLSGRPDEPKVSHAAQRMQLTVTGTQAYLNSYTKSMIDQAYGAPLTAVHTMTDIESKIIFIYPAADANDRTARKLRSSSSFGPTNFAFGVPLRHLNLKFPVSRKVVLPLNSLEVEGVGTIYWLSFAAAQDQPSKADLEMLAAARQVKSAAAAAKRAQRRAAAAALVAKAQS